MCRLFVPYGIEVVFLLVGPLGQLGVSGVTAKEMRKW
jgi:hypothetical protein